MISWAEKGSVMTKMDFSAKTNIHGKIMRWDGKSKLKIDRGEGSVYGLFLYNVVSKRSKENWEDEELISLGFPPPSHDDTVSTTSEESAAAEEADPTIDMVPVAVTDKWSAPLLAVQAGGAEAPRCKFTTTTGPKTSWTAAGFALRAAGTHRKGFFQN